MQKSALVEKDFDEMKDNQKIMKWLVVLVGCCVALSGLAGCGRQNEKIPNQPELGVANRTQQDALGEVWQGEAHEDPLPDFFGEQSQRSAFPDFLIGLWEAEIGPSGWTFKFEPDGSILEMIHSVAGEVDLRQDGVYLEGPDENSYAAFIMGPCEAKYNANTRELRVRIVLDYYRMVLQNAEFEGEIHDYIKGPVSEDGKTWKAEWLNYGWMKGASPPDFNMIGANPMPLVFSKIEGE